MTRPRKTSTVVAGATNLNSAMIFLLGLAAVTLIALMFVPPIQQSPTYHLLVDTRTSLDVPNFWNVVSNLPFVAIGAAGMLLVRERLSTFVLFLGIFLVGFGSPYYHWTPNDGTLFWDRLPMTLSFMAILARSIEERVDPKIGAFVLWPLLALGVFSLLLWRWTGDLRLYAWVQFFPCVALPLLVWLYPTYTGTPWLIAAAGLYAFAKMLEHFDAGIFSAGELVSGHTLKHLAAAGACYAILRYYQTRRPLAVAAPGAQSGSASEPASS